MFDFQFSNNLKSRKVKLKFSEDIEPHEILLDKLAKRKEEELGLSEHKLETPLLKRILDLLFFFGFFSFLVLFAKTLQIGIIEGKSFLAQAQENKYIFRKIQAERGVIYDRNLNQLVFNIPSFDLFCEKRKLPQGEAEKNKVLEEVSDVLKISRDDLEQKLSEDENPEVLILGNLDHQSLIILETKIASGELAGFKVEQNFVRNYKDGEVFSHLIGYTGKINSEELKKEPEFYSIYDYVGRSGIENFYEDILRKNPGEFRIERDALGNIISKETVQYPESGENLVLWLDAPLQRKLKEVLQAELQVVGTKKAAAVALDPKTGGVLSLVSFPVFDNNLFQKGGNPSALKNLLDDPSNLKPLFNRVVSGKYLTGSTIKPLIASAALEEQIIKPEKQLNCQGKIDVKDFWNPEKIWDYEDWTTHGWTDLRKALAESCNVFFYTIGGGYGNQKGLGPTTIKKYLELFGWAEKTGVDLPGEVEGFVPDKDWKKETLNEGWWDGDTYYLSIGQQYLQITPLEVAASFAAIANGGKLLQPLVAKEIIDNEKKVIEEIQPKIVRENFIAPQNLQVVREGMRQAVSGQNSPQASAVLLSSLPVAAAAKTGTAELGNNSYHNWVTVFAPYDDPQIVLSIVIENVKGVQAAALPVAREVLDWYFSKE